MLKGLMEFVPLLLWFALWLAGGWLLALGLFRLRRAEAAMVGLGIGLVMEAWLANLLAHWLPILTAFWLAAGVTGLAGAASALALRPRIPWKRFSFSLSHWLILGFLTLLFNAIGRGLAIFDDYQNLPTVSLMAAGDVPPHFALDPSLRFGYHYFLLLFAAQVMRIGHMFPWSALDLTRGLVLSLPLILAGLWAYRLTRSQAAAFLTGVMMAFAGGVRWILLLLPESLLKRITANITLIGSASATAPDLAHALLANWKIDGGGPIPFPFAFYTGINQPYVMALTGISGSAISIVLILLLTAQRWRHWTAAIVIAILIAALAFANEATFGLLVLSFPLAVLVWILLKRSWKLPDSFVPWIGILGVAVILAIFQGGMVTEIVRGWLGSGSGAEGSYFDAAPSFVWPPAFISAHLGSLSLGNPYQLLVALAEMGPVIFVLPLVIILGLKALRLHKWFEASLIGTSVWALPGMFIELHGPLFTATPRFMSGLFFTCILYSVPVLWVWARRRSEQVRAALVAGGMVTVFSGLLLFGIELIAIRKPVYTSFVGPMDAKMAQDYWNRLEPGALVFDPLVFRSPTIFGRFTDSSPTWYLRKPEWESLAEYPDPVKIHAAGFDYMYFGVDYWEKLSPQVQALLQLPCVQKVAEVEGIRSEDDYRKDFRRLLDIRACH